MKSNANTQPSRHNCRGWASLWAQRAWSCGTPLLGLLRQASNKSASLGTRQPSASDLQCVFYLLQDRATSLIKALVFISIHASDAIYRGNTCCSLQSRSWAWQYKKLLLVTTQQRAHLYHWALDGSIWQASAKRLHKSHYIHLPLFSSSQGESLCKNNSC